MAEVGPGVWDERVHTKNKSVYEERRMGINTGWSVQICNKIPEHIANPGEVADHMDQQSYFSDLNHEWYIKEAEKLVKPLLD